MKKNIKLLSVILIIISGFVVYSNSLSGAFIWDDYHLVKNNIYIRGWSGMGEILTKNIGAGVGRECALYRPLQMITYMWDYSIWKFDVRGYHLSNILLHIPLSSVSVRSCMGYHRSSLIITLSDSTSRSMSSVVL